MTYNSATVLEGFLRSLLAQTYPDIVTYVVDNASADGTQDLLKAYSSQTFKVIANTVNIGVAAGNNQGIAAALGDGCKYVLLLNNDTEFSAGLFDGMEEALNRHSADMLIPKMYFHDEPETIWCAGGEFSVSLKIVRWEPGSGRYEVARPITYGPTCCMLIRRAVFERIGYMDEKYFVYFDDVDFCYRALKAGIVLFYEPSVYLTHKVSSLTGGANSLFSIRFGTRNKTYFIGKYFGRSILWFAILAHEAGWLIRVLTRRESWQLFRIRQNSVRDGLRMLSQPGGQPSASNHVSAD